MTNASAVRAALVAIALLGATSPAAAAVLDQVSPEGNTQHGIGPGTYFQQQITAGITGELASFDVFVMPSDPGSLVNLSINLGAGWQTDAPEFTSVLDPSTPGWANISLGDAPISLSAGDQFMLVVLGSAGVTRLNGSAFPGLYAGGALYNGGAPFDNGNYDLAFRTYMNVAAIPEPQTYALMLAGLALLGFAARRRRNLK